MTEEATKTVLKCAYCREPFEDNPIIKRNKAYCCEACATEALRPPACNGSAGPPLR